MNRLIGASAAAAIIALYALVPAASAAAGITVSPASAPRGASVDISGNVPTSGSAACPAPDAAQLTSTAGLFPPGGFGPSAARDTNGSFNATYTIPASTPIGSYRVGIRCGGGDVGVGADLQVVVAPTATPRIAVAPASAPAGGSITVSGVVPPTGGCPGAAAPILTSTAALFPPDGFGPQVQRDPSGSFSGTYLIPADTPPGAYKIGVRCGGGNVGISASVQVTRPLSTTTSAATATSAPPTSAATTTAPPATSATLAPPARGAEGRGRPTAWVVVAVLVLAGVVGFVVLHRHRRAVPPV